MVFRAARHTVSDVALLAAHPDIAAALDKLVPDFPIESLAQASIPSTNLDPFVQRRQAFTARCLWGSLSGPGEGNIERLAILNVITPSRARQRETLDLLNVKLYSAETAKLTDDERCALLQRLRNASLPPELADGHMRVIPILRRLVHDLTPERKVNELRKLVSYATKHNLDDLHHAIVECVPELLARPSEIDQTVKLCKELFLVPAHDEIRFIQCILVRGELTARPHIKALSELLHSVEDLSPLLRVMLAAVDGDRYYAYYQNVYENRNTIELLNAPGTTLAAKADYCDLVARFNNVQQLAHLLPWLAAEVRNAGIPSNAADRKDFARILALAPHCARNEWSYSTEDIDEPIAHGEEQFNRSIRLTLLNDAKALVSNAELTPEIELSLLVAARRIATADFLHAEDDLRM